MIIDAHTHIYPDAIAAKAIATVVGNTGGRLEVHTKGTFDDLLRSMDEAGVDRSIVLPVATRPGQSRGILRWLEPLRARSDRLLFFGSVHPADADWREILDECCALGLPGLKLHPAYQSYPADSDPALRLYEQALKRGLALYFHAGLDRSLPHCDYTFIERFARVLERFDGERIVLAHGGGEGGWRQVLELLGGRRCYYDVAFVLEALLASPHGRQLLLQNEDFFLFGTDSPWREQKRYVELIRGSSLLTPEQQEKLLGANAARLLGRAGRPPPRPETPR